MKIDIILATYNGARFIRTQICSVLSQTYPHWRLLIHDDGSTDDTVRIVKEMAASDTRIQLIEDGVKGLGPGGNFMHLLRCSEAPYVCLCDQDDLWLENKLSVMLEAIEQKDNTRPQVIVTNAYLWTSGQDNRIKGKSNSCVYTKLKDVLFVNGGMQGATMILNATMRKYINKPYRHIAMHDQVITLAGIVTQGIDVLNVTLFCTGNMNRITQLIFPFLSKKESSKPSEIQDCLLLSKIIMREQNPFTKCTAIQYHKKNVGVLNYIFPTLPWEKSSVSFPYGQTDSH